MLSYYYNESIETNDPRKPHQYEPNQPVTEEILKYIGVEYYRLSETEDLIKQVKEFADKREYKNQDVVNISPKTFGDAYQDKLDIFFQEHIHEDEEIRLILEGSGYFDVRDKDDKWIRIKLDPYDMIVLPAGIYHRFTPDENNFTKAMRLFKEEPKWTPINRPADENSYRKEYVETYVK